MAPKKRSLKSLSAGRPPTSRPRTSMSRKASRSLINKHHQLQKRRRQAITNGDLAGEASLSAELDGLGGLARYQQASLQGQSADRGGDTSKVLLDWLPLHLIKKSKFEIDMLEVGALSTKNACSVSDFFKVVHIDLNSQEAAIQQQDFMQRPLPKEDPEMFDVVSLSLVLNFVPDSAMRGEMLRRTIPFLRDNCKARKVDLDAWFPALFVVLPRSCVANSRYLTENSFKDLMATLGYSLRCHKTTQKLDYSLWHYDGFESVEPLRYPKREINPGPARNNFYIALD